ncbi:ABR019Cp [Eremothecium gossypii ATCC 10895]|uniref:ABR019Cp n=1 Tax=Eremothecium gossypii (strain ATCC 10895 / CBS 109.51 / FGSC 9923 / NRRL Y-1056) TaxID=284811 RepID=Q75DK2_EREGS|nr:ABR019Cp [Eremothecium gossypii ATCC 10895]AAS50789.1 ABR019Cp [Eremothecium gossypii ATCC 10895]AEY95078.1 FABR019Cp [Eremothecium gossypii FDAG1]
MRAGARSDRGCGDGEDAVAVGPPGLAAGSLGAGGLFGGGSGDEQEHSGAAAAAQERYFVSSSGQVGVLREQAAMERQTVEWTADESYGVDINALLDRIEGAAEGAQRAARAPGRVPQALWAEKWRPQRFVDLVGNESNNRKVMRWLRQWSALVFGEALPGRASANAAAEQPEDPLQRPQKRILLLHGPPGIGKTSVAHVLARQAGYAVMELNASDERGGTRLREKVRNCLFNDTFNSQPVCLVADEIDGSAENGLIRTLVDIVNADARATSELLGRLEHGKRKRARHKYSGKVLVRPIVAICNNVYARALEDLRPHCQIVAFRPPGELALLERLELVCEKEGVPADKKTLKQMAELSQGDIRNALNNLQFMSVTDGTGSPASGRRKDTGVPWFKLCNKLFRNNPHAESRAQFQELLSEVELSSSYEKVADGCFQLYPAVKFSDMRLQKPGAISDWLYFFDRMSASLYEHNGELLRYCPMAIMEFFVLFSDIANRQDQVIKSMEYEVREKGRRHSAMVAATRKGMHPDSQIFTSTEALLLETLPYLDIMLSPDLTAIHDQLTRQKIMDNIVPLLHQFGLQLHHIKDTDYRNLLAIQPPFNELVALDPKRSRETASKRPHVLNILLAKLEEEKAKKRTVRKVRHAEEDLEVLRRNTPATPADFFKNQYTRLNAANVPVVPAAAPGAPPASTAEGPVRRGASPPEPELKIWVKYKEGFSNAVRKNVKWGTLWQ